MDHLAEAMTTAPPSPPSDPHVLPSPSGGPPINLLAPSPFPPTGHRVPLGPAARSVVDAFVGQHGLAPPANLRKTLAAYLNVSADKLKNHLTGRRRQSAKARANERKREEREREERCARDEIAREERRAQEEAEREERHAQEEAEREMSRIWAAVLAEWDQREQSSRRKAGLEYYWASGKVWIDGTDIRDVPPPSAAPTGDDESAGDAQASGGPERDLVDALLLEMFGPKNGVPAALGASAGVDDQGAYTPPPTMTAADACTPPPPPPLVAVPFDLRTSTSSAPDSTASRTPVQPRAAFALRRAATTAAAAHAALGRPHPYARRARTSSSSSSSAVAPAARRRSQGGRR